MLPHHRTCAAHASPRPSSVPRLIHGKTVILFVCREESDLPSGDAPSLDCFACMVDTHRVCNASHMSNGDSATQSGRAYFFPIQAGTAHMNNQTATVLDNVMHRDSCSTS
eukprot:362160-Chlamydomonas_euryale.AAC.3